MNLVFIEPNKIDAIPFTASDVIATYAEVSHHAIQQIISKHESDLKEFGLVAFKMRAKESVEGCISNAYLLSKFCYFYKQVIALSHFKCGSLLK